MQARDRDGMTALLDAVLLDGKVEFVRALLDAHADVNRKTHNGCPALMKAARRFEKEIVGLLAKAGAKK